MGQINAPIMAHAILAEAVCRLDGVTSRFAISWRAISCSRSG